jgi:hypothetical protein
VGRKGAHDISTCKSVVKRTQEDDDDSALCSHSHPHFNNSDMFACFINSYSFFSCSLAPSIDALTFVGILSFLYEAHALSVGRSVELVRLALVSLSFVLGRKTTNSAALWMTSFAVLSDRSKRDAKESFVVLN